MSSKTSSAIYDTESNEDLTLYVVATIACQWGSGTWYPLDGAPGDETEHIIAQASVTTLSFAFK